MVKVLHAAQLAGAVWLGVILFPEARAQQISFESAGARVGGSPTDPAHFFHQAEGFLNLNLPWEWNLGREWTLQSRFDFSAGWLNDRGEDSVVATAGPSLLLERSQLPISLEGGVSPTMLSRHIFVDKDFGELFQFTSHVGVNLELPAHLRLGYRFQHMSNAGLSAHNPGLNLHMVALSYRF